MLQQIKDNPFRWLIFSAMLLLIGAPLALFLLSYQIKHLDYRTGRVRTSHMIADYRWKITLYDTWITPFTPQDQLPDWHLIGYQNQKIQQTMINSKALRLNNDIYRFNAYLYQINADQPTKKLVANFIMNQINQPDDDRNAFVNTVNAFDCFFKSMPWPESDEGSITQDQILQLIDNCSNP
tara:strand:+ start:71 stop:613 length:543 start_codon:yes stop_codon:yes gene_type:complete